MKLVFLAPALTAALAAAAPPDGHGLYLEMRAADRTIGSLACSQTDLIRGQRTLLYIRRLPSFGEQRVVVHDTPIPFVELNTRQGAWAIHLSMILKLDFPQFPKLLRVETERLLAEFPNDIVFSPVVETEVSGTPCYSTTARLSERLIAHLTEAKLDLLEEKEVPADRAKIAVNDYLAVAREYRIGQKDKLLYQEILWDKEGGVIANTLFSEIRRDDGSVDPDLFELPKNLPVHSMSSIQHYRVNQRSLLNKYRAAHRAARAEKAAKETGKKALSDGRTNESEAKPPDSTGKKTTK